VKAKVVTSGVQFMTSPRHHDVPGEQDQRRDDVYSDDNSRDLDVYEENITRHDNVYEDKFSRNRDMHADSATRRADEDLIEAHNLDAVASDAARFLLMTAGGAGPHTAGDLLSPSGPPGASPSGVAQKTAFFTQVCH
jgi:hypothetical protein